MDAGDGLNDGAAPVGREPASESAVGPIPAAATRPLRQTLLRPGAPAEQSVYPGDDDAPTVHFGAHVTGGGLVGVASLYREARPGADHPEAPAWRLRGMAVASERQRAGVGAALLAACVAHVEGAGGTELWCNARVPAVGFYERAGFETVSPVFDIAGVGPHVVMRRPIGGGEAPRGASG